MLMFSYSAPLLAIASALLMATYAIIFKLTGLPAETLAFFRLFFGAVFLAIYIFLQGGLRSVFKLPSWRSALTGLCLSGFIVLYLEALNYTSMANAVMTIYMAPMIAMLISPVLFNEKLTFKSCILILFAFMGLAMMQKQTSSVSELFNTGLLYGLASALCYSGFIILNKYPLNPIQQKSHSLHQLLCGSIIIMPLLMGQSFEFSLYQWTGLIMAGILPGCLATALAVSALQKMETSLFSILIYIEPIAILLFGWTFFSEQLVLSQLIGMFIILISGVLLILSTKATPPLLSKTDA